MTKFDEPQKGFQYISQDEGVSAIPLKPVTALSLKEELNTCSSFVRQWVKQTGFEGKPRTVCLVPDPVSGDLSFVLYGTSEKDHERHWDAAFLAIALPQEHVYAFESVEESMVLSWMLAAYEFHYDHNKGQKIATLKIPSTIDIGKIKNKADSIAWIRTLINCPANIATPEFLAREAEKLAMTYQGHFKEIVGDALVDAGFPLVLTVGKASAHPPRFVEITWGHPGDFKLALVGKGITFDTGGLNIKTGNYMDLMKKDMGGAAYVLGLARWIMAEKLPIYLKAYLPLAENAIGAQAMRPGDIIKAGNGDTVEITDTDAEGRLILADALTRATLENPDLIIDFATLTGAARVALGAEIPVFFTNQDLYQKDLLSIGAETLEPVWALPLWNGYDKALKSKIATLQNATNSSYGGAITAALFLQHFVKETPWIHIDFMGWNVDDRPGRPIGGEAQAFGAFSGFIKKLKHTASKSKALTILLFLSLASFGHAHTTADQVLGASQYSGGQMEKKMNDFLRSDYHEALSLYYANRDQGGFMALERFELALQRGVGDIREASSIKDKKLRQDKALEASLSWQQAFRRACEKNTLEKK